MEVGFRRGIHGSGILLGFTEVATSAEVGLQKRDSVEALLCRPFVLHLLNYMHVIHIASITRIRPISPYSAPCCK